ncbi:hypothetical protein, partial [Moorena sp. SIO2C4]|uniref:hypothetical protein n=1 Tax=Moorena sp. SIO2C4 TaxID=2607824 RepID=UPI002579521F
FRFPFPSWEGLGVGSDSRFPIPDSLPDSFHGQVFYQSLYPHGSYSDRCNCSCPNYQANYPAASHDIRLRITD